MREGASYVNLRYTYTMRHLIVLSGNSLKNKAWGELIVEHYSPMYDSVFMLEYSHWESGEPLIDFVSEEAKLRAHVATLAPDTEVILFAKSAGSLLGLLAIAHGAVTPARSVFFGMPLDMAAGGIFKDDWSPLTSFRVPAIAFHNLEDPTTSYEFTKATLKEKAPHITLVTTHEADHWYGDLTTYDPYINTLITPR